MLDGIMDAVVTALQAEGINAFREYPEKRADMKTGISVSVGLESCKFLSPGMGEYLGTRAGTGGGADIELFGRRLELTLRFEIYSPFGAAYGTAGCVQYADRLRSCIGRLPSGIKALDMDCGEICADDRLSCYRCICTFRCMAFLVAESDGTETEFLDFVLKGTVNIGN